MKNPKVKIIKTNSAPAPVGPYSQAILAGNWLYCSGQIALDPSSGTIIGSGNVEEETSKVLANLLAVLNEVNADFSNVVKTTIYLKNIEDFEKVNKIYEQSFNGFSSPARACVEVSALPKGVSVEIDCVAWLG